MGGIYAEALGKVVLDGAVLRLHFVECGIKILLLHSEDGQRNFSITAGFDEGLDSLLVPGDDVVVAPQVVFKEASSLKGEKGSSLLLRVL